MDGEIQEEFKWTMMESDECNRIGSTKRRKRWKQHLQQQFYNKNKNINNKNHKDKKIDKKYSVRVSDNNETHLMSYIIEQKQQQQQGKKHTENTLVSLLLKKYYINWRSCFCYLSWSNFRWLAVISASMKTITLQTAQEQEKEKQQQEHKNEIISEAKEKKGYKRKHNNYSEFVQSSVYSAASFKKIQILRTTTTTPTTTTTNITPTIKETLSSASSAIITSTIIPTTTTTQNETNFSTLRQKLPICSWDRETTKRTTIISKFYTLLLLLLALLNICQHHHGKC